MEILIKKGLVGDEGRCIRSTNYKIYSTDKLNSTQIRALIRSIDYGQDITHEEHEINRQTSNIYKWGYTIRLICDSSD